jgi:O-acetyl-ADP-ribose deacetylase
VHDTEGASVDTVDIDEVRVELVVGDITAQPDLDAVVNAANAQLLPGGGVAGAIHAAAGPGLVEECRPLAPIAPGGSVLTGAHGLPNRAVIHCLGPVYGHDEPAAELLARCYRGALELADGSGLRSIGFPALSTGVFGYPRDPAAEVAVRTILATSPSLATVRTVRMVLFSGDDLAAHRRALRRLAG